MQKAITAFGMDMILSQKSDPPVIWIDKSCLYSISRADPYQDF